MAARTTGPRVPTQLPESGRVGLYSPESFAPAFYQNLLRVDYIVKFETAYQSGGSALSRLDFVRTQLARIAALYAPYAETLNALSIDNGGAALESVIASAASTASGYVEQPFGVLLSGLSLIATIGAKEKKEVALAQFNAKADYLKACLTALQTSYSTYQAELNRATYTKLALIGGPLLYLLYKHRSNGSSKTDNA